MNAPQHRYEVRHFVTKATTKARTVEDARRDDDDFSPSIGVDELFLLLSSFA